MRRVPDRKKSLLIDSMACPSPPVSECDSVGEILQSPCNTAAKVMTYEKFMKDWSSCDPNFVIEFQGRHIIGSDDAAFAFSHKKHCYEVYKASAQPVLKLLVIGRFKNIIYTLNQIPKVRAEIQGPGIDLDVWNNFSGGPMNASIITGMDLPMAESKEFGWSSKTNDCYMLGAIHNFIPFYVASPRVLENIYNADQGQKRLTTFARELIGLIRFGYRLCTHGTLGEVFVCVDKEAAAKATLLDYETEFKRLDTLMKSSDPTEAIQYFTDLEPMVPYDVILLTTAEYEKPDEASWFAKQLLCEEQLLLDALQKRGLRATRIAWSNASFPWCLTHSAVLRSTWDYFDRFKEFSSWMDSVEEKTKLLNPPGLVRWNLDKHYLRDLEKLGIKIPPTAYIEQGQKVSLHDVFVACAWTEAVLKPTVSGAARHTYRVNAATVSEHESILSELLRDEAMMLQHFIPSILTERGEVSLIVIGGHCTHAVRKVAKPGDFRVQDDHGGTVHAHTPTPDEIAFAEKAVAACPQVPLYGRVDTVRDEFGGLLLMELELVEPELFFRFHPPAAEAFATAIAEALQRI